MNLPPEMTEALTRGLPHELTQAMELATVGLLALGVPLFMLEVWRLWRRGALTGARVRGMATSTLCALPASLVEVLLLGALLGVFFGAWAIAPWSVPIGWGTALICLLLVDFLYYWEHRLGHEVNVLWALYHSVHHSADHYDQTIGLRVSFVDFFFSPLIYLPLVLMGFHPLLVLGCVGLVLAWQQWIHTEEVGKLPWLDGWLNTPSNHRVHHGSNPQYLDRNYGGILMIWDRLFGTWEPEGEAVVYGLVDPLESRHPIDVHAHVFSKLMHKVRITPGFWNKARVLFRNDPF